MRVFYYTGLGAVALFLLSGCDKTQMTLGGAGVGTGAGAAIGYAIDGGAGGAILGGVLGGLGGAMAGNAIADSNERDQEKKGAAPQQVLVQPQPVSPAYVNCNLNNQIRQENYQMEQERIDLRKQELEMRALEIRRKELEIKEKELENQRESLLRGGSKK